MRNRVYIGVMLAVALIVIGCGPKLAYHKLDNEGQVPRITLGDAKAAYDSGEAVIVDARGGPSYKQEHIKGALDITSEDQFDQLPKGKKIIVYCS